MAIIFKENRPKHVFEMRQILKDTSTVLVGEKLTCSAFTGTTQKFQTKCCHVRSRLPGLYTMLFCGLVLLNKNEN